jgi:hypothetical protein
VVPKDRSAGDIELSSIYPN